jgi:hypothetical protein
MSRPDLSYDFAAMVAETRYEDLPEERDRGREEKHPRHARRDPRGQRRGACGARRGGAGARERRHSGKHGSRFGSRVPAVMAGVRQRRDGALPGLRRPRAGRPPPEQLDRACCAGSGRARGGVSGRELIAAVAAGQDMFLRLRRNVEWKQDWHLTTVSRRVSAAAAARCRVLGLDADAPWTRSASPACSPVAPWNWHMASAATCEACTPASAPRARCSPRCWRRKGPQASAACSRARPACSMCTSRASTIARRCSRAWEASSAAAPSSTSRGRPAAPPMASSMPRWA